eukprot:1043521-Prymnesium_polylepis.2
MGRRPPPSKAAAAPMVEDCTAGVASPHVDTMGHADRWGCWAQALRACARRSVLQPHANWPSDISRHDPRNSVPPRPPVVQSSRPQAGSCGPQYAVPNPWRRPRPGLRTLAVSRPAGMRLPPKQSCDASRNHWVHARRCGVWLEDVAWRAGCVVRELCGSSCTPVPCALWHILRSRLPRTAVLLLVT